MLGNWVWNKIAWVKDFVVFQMTTEVICQK